MQRGSHVSIQVYENGEQKEASRGSLYHILRTHGALVYWGVGYVFNGKDTE